MLLLPPKTYRYRAHTSSEAPFLKLGDRQRKALRMAKVAARTGREEKAAVNGRVWLFFT